MPRVLSLARSSLRWRFLLVLLPVTLGTTLSVGLIARQVLVNSYERESRTRALVQLQAQALPLEARLRAVGQGMERLTTLGVEGTEPTILEGAAFFLAQWDEVEALIVADPSGGIGRYTRADRTGVHREALDRESAPMRMLRGRSRVGRDGGEGTVRLLSAAEEDREYVWLQTQARDDGSFAGAILRREAFVPALAPLLHSRDGSLPARVLLFDSRGRSIAWDPDAATATRTGSETLAADRGARREDPRDDELTVRQVAPDLGLAVVQVLPAAEFVAGLARLDRALLLFECGAFFLIALVILLLARRVVRPIERLTRTMGDVARGDLSQRLPVNGEDEIGQLSRSFNTMISDLHTTHVALKAQSARLAAALQEVEDVEAMKDSFLALVSHEVRTPLTSIMGGVEFLREEFGNDYDATQAEFMGIVYDSARRLAGFMNDAIMMASLQASRSRSNFESFSITALLHSKFDEIVLPATAQGLRVENRMDAQREFFVHGDWTLMQVSFEKVLHNAVRHNRPGGQVIVEVVERILEDQDGDLDRLMTARGIEPFDPQMQWRAIRVFNTGPVIPEDKVEGLFARFELTHDISNHQRGSGLSLPIAHYVLGYHGGCIEVRAVGSEGMAFYLVVPGRLSVQARTAAVALPSGIDETVTAARLVQAAAEDVERLEAGIEEAEAEDRRQRFARGETVSGPVEVVGVVLGPRSESEEVGVGSDARGHRAQPDPSRH